MDRRVFLKGGTLSASAAAAIPAGQAAAAAWPATPAAPAGNLTRICDVRHAGRAWTVFEDLTRPDGELRFVDAEDRALVFGRSLERVKGHEDDAGQPDWLGLELSAIGLADRDLLAERLLAHGGDPDYAAVRRAAPPVGSRFDPDKLGWRMPWTAIVGVKQAGDTMPVFRNGRTRTYRPGHHFPDLRAEDAAEDRLEGRLGGWLPAVRKVIPIADGAWYDITVFGDVTSDSPQEVQTWHRTARVENGRVVDVVHGYSYADYPPRRTPPAAEAFYGALLAFADAWTGALADLAPPALPDPVWADLTRHAFAKELIVRPGGVYPRYGAVDRDYVGSEYDGFQDTFTSSLYANLEWGRFDQARAVLDQYFTTFVQDDGMVRMRGPGTSQFGLTLSLIARYLLYTGDLEVLRRHRGKIAETAALLVEMHEESLRRPAGDPGHGLIHGWSESDACLHPDPTVWWRPYWSNTAFSARGLRDIASVWAAIAPGEDATAADWKTRADVMAQAVERGIRASVRRDLDPPYVGPYPGTTLTFRQSLAQERPSPQGWPHRVYAELLHADILPPDLSDLVIDAFKGHGGTALGVVANVGPGRETGRDLLGFISYGYAQELLRRDRIEEYLLFLYSHRWHCHTRGAWMAGEVTGITGGLPLFCVPAQLTIPLLVRWMLAFEDSDRDVLHLGRALPRDWLGGEHPIGLDDAPTRWGRVSLAIQPGETITARVAFEGVRGPAETRLRLRLPQGRRLRSARANGRPARIEGEDIVLATAGGGRFDIRAETRR